MRASPGDTIAAISTPLGPGGIAVVRVSGDRALEIGDAIFRGHARLSDCRSHTVHHGHIVSRNGDNVDEVLATVMRAPRTYTTEDMLEIACHGGTVAAREILATCLAAGARPSRRGEFTERAFLGGRIDLVQAEAVADIVSAQTPKGLEVALGQLTGSLSGDLASLRDKLLSFRAEVEALIDFPSDEIATSTVDQIADIGRSAADDVARLLSHCELGAAVRDGISVALVGKPNVGKSSLMNALLKRDRSIVTAIPGTTRDAIEECLHVGGVAVRLIDTAGWRDALDAAEQAGVARAKAAALGSALVALVVDASAALDEQDVAIVQALRGTNTVVLGNKIDLGREVSEDDIAGLMDSRSDESSARKSVAVQWVSATRGDGLDGLRELLVTQVLGALPGEESPAVSNVRHVDALKRVASGIDAALSLLADGAPPETTAVEISDAATALGEITGETTPEEVLARVFERFCVGK